MGESASANVGRSGHDSQAERVVASAANEAVASGQRRFVSLEQVVASGAREGSAAVDTSSKSKSRTSGCDRTSGHSSGGFRNRLAAQREGACRGRNQRAGSRVSKRDVHAGDTHRDGDRTGGVSQDDRRATLGHRIAGSIARQGNRITAPVEGRVKSDGRTSGDGEVLNAISTEHGSGRGARTN